MKKKTDVKRQAILDVAAQVFREFGFKRALMSEICARLGGSKATLYNYFPSKEELFFEVVAASTEAEVEAVHHALSASNEDIAESLCHFGERLLTFLYSPPLQAQRHLAISESGRTELGRIVYERGVLRTQHLVTEFLQKAMSLGKLKQADPVLATKHLYSLLESELIDQFLFQQLGEISEKDIEGFASRAIGVFMAAYGPSTSAEK
jgi:AcrR family transcriptional regulator